MNNGDHGFINGILFMRFINVLVINKNIDCMLCREVRPAKKDIQDI